MAIDSKSVSNWPVILPELAAGADHFLQADFAGLIPPWNPDNGVSLASVTQTTAILLDDYFYCRSNTRMFGSLRPAVCTVIVKVLRLHESLICWVSMILPLILSVISRVRPFTRRIEDAEPGATFGRW